MSHDAVREEIKERYDKFANAAAQGGEETVNRARAYFWSRKIETALSLGCFPKGGHLLEIGCNMGQQTFSLAARRYRLTGVDLSPAAVAIARQRAAARAVTNVEFLVGDAEKLEGCPDSYFDGVVSFSALRYVPDLQNALVAIRRVLKPRATAVLDFPNRLCPWFYVKSFLGSEHHPHDHWFTPADLRRRLARAGLVPLATRTMLFTPTVAPNSVWKLFQAADWVGERIPVINRLAGIIMIAARKP